MKSKLFFLVLFLNAVSFCRAQDSAVVLDTSMFDLNLQKIYLTALNGWIFKEGNDTNWAKKNIDTAGWKRFNPYELTVKNADKNGRMEGWFRLRVRLDSSFQNVPLGISINIWAATDIYIDGRYIGSSGNTGINGKPYEENQLDVKPPHPLNLQTGRDYIIAFHVVEYRSPFNHSLLKTEMSAVTYSRLISLTGPNTQLRYIDYLGGYSNFWTIIVSVAVVLSLLFLFLFYQSPGEKTLLTISITVACSSLGEYCNLNSNTAIGISFIEWASYLYLSSFFLSITSALNIITITKIFRRRVSVIIAFFSITIFCFSVINTYFFGDGASTGLAIYILLANIYLIVSSWKNLRGAQWAVVAGTVLTYIWFLVYAYNAKKYYPQFPFPLAFLYLGGLFLSFPLSLLIYVGMRFKEILNDVQINANQVLQLSEEKKEQAIRQQKILEEEVARQTVELRTSFDNLKATQSQLIQTEKMASLGELTAGIAHEIQNPLNFVNNFSEVSNEMIDEMKEELATGNLQLVTEIADDIKQNLEKINHHGKRADAIVKGMLQHSRKSEGVKEPTDINALCDEYLRLAYHGLRAKDKDFNADFKTDFDNSIGKINIIPQDIGRVLLNLYNNAFYAAYEKKKKLDGTFEPFVNVSTQKENGSVVIKVADNGDGIPQNIIDKIFQPFFTTKPTGQGTGLGLSLSYDIIKAHGGEIKVETKEGEGAEFIIYLPINNA